MLLSCVCVPNVADSTACLLPGDDRYQHDPCLTLFSFFQSQNVCCNLHERHPYTENVYSEAIGDSKVKKLRNLIRIRLLCSSTH